MCNEALSGRCSARRAALVLPPRLHAGIHEVLPDLQHPRKQRMESQTLHPDPSATVPNLSEQYAYTVRKVQAILRSFDLHDLLLMILSVLRLAQEYHLRESHKRHSRTNTRRFLSAW